MHSYAQYQVKNAIVAIKTLEVLGFDIEADTVLRGIADMNWPGRMEMVEDHIFVDGGHNVDGIDAFIESVKNDGCEGNRHLIFSAVADKQVEIISRMLVECCAFDRISICEIDSYRATKLLELKTIFDKAIAECGKDMSVCMYEGVREAVDEERGLIVGDDRLYICGSLYLVGAVKEYVEARKK